MVTIAECRALERHRAMLVAQRVGFSDLLFGAHIQALAPRMSPLANKIRMAAKHRGERMAGYRSGTRRSAMLASGPVLGHCGRGVLSQFGPLYGLELSLNRILPSAAAFQYGERVLSTHYGRPPDAVGGCRSLQAQSCRNDSNQHEAGITCSRLLGRKQLEADLQADLPLLPPPLERHNSARCPGRQVTIGWSGLTRQHA